MERIAIALFLALSFASPVVTAKDLKLARYEVQADRVLTQQQQQLLSEVEVLSRKGQIFEIIVPHAARERVSQTFSRVLVLEEDLQATMQALWEDPSWIASYRDFSQVTLYLHEVAERFPEIAQLESYGQSQQGLPLYALKISDQVGVDEEEPELMLTSATHGDELITVEVVLELIEKLVTGYGQDARLTGLVDGAELYFIPVVNPDGFTSRNRYANGVDPNRNYPWPERPAVSSVPCISDLRDFYDTRSFAGSIDFHAYGEMIMYPWAYTYRASKDKAAFDRVTRHMAEANGYVYGQISKVIYVAKGSSADYYYWTNGAMALGIEVAQTKVPRSSDIPRIVADNTESTWRFIESFLER